MTIAIFTPNASLEIRNTTDDVCGLLVPFPESREIRFQLFWDETASPGDIQLMSLGVTGEVTVKDFPNVQSFVVSEHSVVISLPDWYVSQEKFVWTPEMQAKIQAGELTIPELIKPNSVFYLFIDAQYNLNVSINNELWGHVPVDPDYNNFVLELHKKNQGLLFVNSN